MRSTTFGLLFLLISATSFAQYHTIHDLNFAKYLNEIVPDAMFGNDLFIFSASLDTVKQIDCSNRNIKSIDGIQYFNSLEELHCGNNEISKLPSLPNSLKKLTCSENKLDSLPTLPLSLWLFDCDHNQLTELPALPPKLNTLYCNDNLLTALPLLPDSLVHLWCRNNHLTSLPSFPSLLKILHCNNNKLNSLPDLSDSLVSLYCQDNRINLFSYLPNKLEYLDCSRNQITRFNKFPDSLISLYCDSNELTHLPNFPDNIRYISLVNNKLTSIPKFSRKVQIFKCMDNPDLKCLPIFSQTWFSIFAVEKNTQIRCLPVKVRQRFWHNKYDNSTNLPVCDAGFGCPLDYQIQGGLFKDTFINCNLDSLRNGQKVSGVKTLQYIDNKLVSQAYTDQNGKFTFNARLSDSVEIELDPELSTLVSCPPSGKHNIVITNTDTVYGNQDFGIKCNGVDLGVISAFSSFKPAENSLVYIQAGDVSRQFNLNCAYGEGGVVSVIIDGPASYLSPAQGALIPDSVIGNTLTYNVPDFGQINLDSAFNFILKTDTSAEIGSDVCFTILVTAQTTDINSSNNTLSYCGKVATLSKANSKTSYPIDSTTPNSWITYTIRYQNTETDVVNQVTIRDTLSEYLDESTFTYLGGSVQPQIYLSGRNVLFNLPHINLPTVLSSEQKSHGWLQYKVKTKADLPPLSKVENTASIYFDLDSLEVTNTTINQYANRINQEISSCDSANVNGTTYFSSQTVTDTIGVTIMTTEIEIKTVDIETTINGATISSNQENAIYQWLDCKDSYSSIASATEQSYTATENGEYAVEVAANGCIDTSDCVSISTLNTIEKSLKTKFSIYPNPTKGKVTIEFDQNKTSIEARLLSYTGKEIETKKVSSTNDLNLNLDVPSGLYFLEVTTDNGNKSVVKVLKH